MLSVVQVIYVILVRIVSILISNIPLFKKKQLFPKKLIV